MDRDSPKDLQRVGFWAALLGGVAGAWLGFNAGNQLLAPITAIVGAALLANLALLVGDIFWERGEAQPQDSAPVRELASQPSS